jgi:hypothetical protein
MAIKVDGTNSKIIFLAGTGNATTLTSALTATPWTLTLPPTAGTAGQVLTTDGTGVLSWAAGGGGAITVADDTTTNSTRYPMFANITTGSLATAYVASTEYTFNPASGTLSAPHVESSAGIHLNAQVITQSYTIPAGTNGLSAGPITQGPGVSVTVNPGQAWVIT